MDQNRYLYQISQELARFDDSLLGKFRCPTCLQDLPLESFGDKPHSAAISEEHIIPAAVGGIHTTFLCKKCNSTFGTKQTKWPVEWIELTQDGTLFPKKFKKQRVSLNANGLRLGGSMQQDADCSYHFFTDRSRTNPKDYDEFWQNPAPSEYKINISLPVFSNEQLLRVGFLAAAYGLWFKHFGYSFILQSSQDIVRRQILQPNELVMDWEFLIDTSEREIKNPGIGLMKFDKDYFPIAWIYDHIVLLPSAAKKHPDSTSADRISKKMMDWCDEIKPRFQHRCGGPAVLICDGQVIVQPDMISTATVPPQYVWLDGWA